MRAAVIIGVILIMAGVVSLVYGGFTYKEKETSSTCYDGGISHGVGCRSTSLLTDLVEG